MKGAVKVLLFLILPLFGGGSVCFTWGQFRVETHCLVIKKKPNPKLSFMAELISR